MSTQFNLYENGIGTGIGGNAIPPCAMDSRARNCRGDVWTAHIE